MKFRTISCLALLVFATRADSWAAQAPNSANIASLERGFELGSKIGNCIVARCQIFLGTIIDEPSTRGDSVAVRVSEWVLKGTGGDELVRVPYEDHQGQSGGDGGGSAAAAWQYLEPRRGGIVTVAVGTENGWGVRSGVPVLVTSSDQEGKTIRDLVDVSRRLSESPELLIESCASLSRRPDPALAGYLFVHLTRGRPQGDRERSTMLLFQMLTSPSVPQRALDSVVFWLILKYNGLPPSGRASLVSKFAALSYHQNPQTASLAIEAIRRFASTDSSFAAKLPRNVLEEVRTAYRATIQRGVVGPDKLLETQFEVK
ncbi:MAG: hypothetical protein JNL98_37970 [Bryobacterales bacterium]|nr:hypothetical protein [Bryobacterales bacterium]